MHLGLLQEDIHIAFSLQHSTGDTETLGTQGLVSLPSPKHQERETLGK